ncbi:MAG: deoxyribodipyrimidine photo-lyase, partial [Aliivibrio sp.]|nr:deoxyribodipyrimidine photo-lyase [Aliivibrio sp.]
MDYKPTMQCVWFRSDLRVADNPALSAALANKSPTIAIFVASDSHWQQHNKASIQIDLIKRRLLELEKELRQLNIPLLVFSCPWFKGVPPQLHALCKDLGISHLFANKEYEADELSRDDDVVTQLPDVQCAFYDAKCAVKVGKILNKTHQPYKVFTPFKKAWREYFYQH